MLFAFKSICLVLLKTWAIKCKKRPVPKAPHVNFETNYVFLYF